MKNEQEMNVGVCPYSSTGLWKFVSKPIEQMTDREILDWFIELSKLDGCKNININDYLKDKEIIQFFRENGISKESYDKYLYVYCSDLTEEQWDLIHQLCDRGEI